MQEAELMGLLRTLLIIVFIYYAFRFLARIFAPLLMKKVVNKMKEKAQQQYNQQNPQKQNSSTREGETIIDKKPNSKNEGKSSVGEYVDFEEID
jgi:hypothetical protein|tara:strand:+ start:1672 stop:1953 length:282 start_codon:yes stop_codon:yes gene_type:complete